MLYALIDGSGRIVDSKDGGDMPDGWVEFTWDVEPDPYVDAMDFVIRDGVAYYEPTAEALEDSETRRGIELMAGSLPDAVAELSWMASDNATDISDLMDAIAELSEIVSGLMEAS